MKVDRASVEANEEAVGRLEAITKAGKPGEEVCIALDPGLGLRERPGLNLRKEGNKLTSDQMVDFY